MHLTVDVVERLLAGQLDQEERNAAVRHLLSRCSGCVRLARTVAERFGMTYSAGRFRKVKPKESELKKYDPLFERLQGLDLEARSKLIHERLIAAGQWASLQKHPQARRLSIISSDPSLHTWGLYDRLLDAARETASAHPEKGIEIALLAVAVADKLDTGRYGEARIVDFKATALAVLGNCKRIAEDFEGARADLQQALAPASRCHLLARQQQVCCPAWGDLDLPAEGQAKAPSLWRRPQRVGPRSLSSPS